MEAFSLSWGSLLEDFILISFGFFVMIVWIAITLRFFHDFFAPTHDAAMDVYDKLRDGEKVEPAEAALAVGSLMSTTFRLALAALPAVLLALAI